MHMAYSGKYPVINRDKYIGNPNKITYRSSWEKDFMQYCARNKNVLNWCSENPIIKYFCPTDKKWHRYFPDFYIRVKQSDGNIKEFIIEVKPIRQTRPPKQGKSRRNYLYEQFTWAKNKAKWEAATRYCEKRKWEFKIVTEKELKIGYK